MKHTQLLIITLILITFSCKSQQINFLTTSDYDSILIDGVNWMDIAETYGDIDNIQAIYGNSIKYEERTEPSLVRYFYSDSFNLRFQSDSDLAIDYYFDGFRIKNNLSNITIIGKIITIGDDISKLGLVKINTDKDGIKGIIFALENDDSSIFIEFDQNNNKITGIQYISFD